MMSKDKIIDPLGYLTKETEVTESRKANAAEANNIAELAMELNDVIHQHLNKYPMTLSTLIGTLETLKYQYLVDNFKETYR